MYFDRQRLLSGEEGFMISSNPTRGGGLVAVAAAALFIMADLLGLFVVSFQGPTDAIIIQNVIAAGIGVLLLLALITLYGRRLEAMGTPGLAGFLVTLIGIALALGAFIWASSLADQGWVLFFIWASLFANLGWILFGALGLEAQVYPRAVAGLIIGAVLYGVANTLIASGTQNSVLDGSLNYVVGILVFDIIFDLAIAWLGVSIFRRRNDELSTSHR